MKKNLIIVISRLLMMTFILASCSKSSDGDSDAPAPTITSITPYNVNTGENITITGTNLSGASLTISNRTATITSNTSTSIKAVVPPTASVGVEGVVVTTSGGTATDFINITGSSFAPTVTSISPTSIKIGGTLTITGTGYADGVGVEIATKVATVTAYTPTTITVIIPSGIALGASSLRVTTLYGTIFGSGPTIIP